jgi:hypothetical protein
MRWRRRRSRRSSRRRRRKKRSKRSRRRRRRRKRRRRITFRRPPLNRSLDPPTKACFLSASFLCAKSRALMPHSLRVIFIYYLYIIHIFSTGSLTYHSELAPCSLVPEGLICVWRKAFAKCSNLQLVNINSMLFLQQFGHSIIYQ